MSNVIDPTMKVRGMGRTNPADSDFTADGLPQARMVEWLMWPSKPLRAVTIVWLSITLSLSGGGFPPLG